jgi:hypothetical protein
VIPLPLDLLIGHQQAAAFLARRADEFVLQDHIAHDRALAMVCERATDGDPVVLAAPGQVWRLREDVDEEDAPATRLTITGRDVCPPRVRVIGDGVEDELLIEVLDMYRLEAWTWAD